MFVLPFMVNKDVYTTHNSALATISYSHLHRACVVRHYHGVIATSMDDGNSKFGAQNGQIVNGVFVSVESR